MAETQPKASPVKFEQTDFDTRVKIGVTNTTLAGEWNTWYWLTSLQTVPKRRTGNGGKRRSVGERNTASCRSRDSGAWRAVLWDREVYLRSAHVVMP
jgi:hypothetical protein